MKTTAAGYIFHTLSIAPRKQRFFLTGDKTLQDPTIKQCPEVSLGQFNLIQIFNRLNGQALQGPICQINLSRVGSINSTWVISHLFFTLASK